MKTEPLDVLEMMKEMEKEMPTWWKIKIVPYKIWAKLYVKFITRRL